MRVCFVSRRFFPAISGMSIYAINLLRQLVAAGHDVTMVSQFYGDPERAKVYGGGPPPCVEGVRVIGLEALGEQGGGDFERDVDAMIETIAAEHARAPFDVLHAQYGYPTGWATLLAAQRLGVPCVVSIQGGDGHWVGSCCDTHRIAMERVLDHAGALLIGGTVVGRGAEVGPSGAGPLVMSAGCDGEVVMPGRLVVDPGDDAGGAGAEFVLRRGVRVAVREQADVFGGAV